MARKVLLEGTGYSYNPTTGIFTFPKYLPQERLILITDISKNKVIYNFSDPSLGYITYSATIDPLTANELTTLQLAYSGYASIGAADEFQILVDEDVQLTMPAETFTDPTNKERVTTPQALIDTDFEYGIQGSKWESAGLINNRPFSYATANVLTGASAITSISFPNASKTVTVTAPAHGLVVGQPIIVTDTYLTNANGNYIVETVTAPNTFTYTASALNSSTISSIYDTNKTSITTAGIFTGAQIGSAPAMTFTNTTGVVSVTTNVPHGLALGNQIAVVGATGLTTVTASGDFYVSSITSPHTFTYHVGLGGGGSINATTVTGYTATSSPAGQAISNQITLSSTTSISIGVGITGTGIPAGTIITGLSGLIATLSQVTTAALSTTAVVITPSIFVRPQTQFLHRPFDGGVLFSTNSSSNFAQAARQTRRYFRYQSGKGIMLSSGTILKPYANLDQITASGTTITVTTKERHNLLQGTSITVGNATESAYNGTFTVAQVLSSTQFTYTALSTPSSSVASGVPTLSVNNWYGSKNRLGIFDNQNGLFFEWDGQTLYAVRRSSVYQIAGKVSATQGSNIIYQSDASFPTEFAKQLIIGDFIVLRGISYRVTDIQSDTALTISPSYRGASTQFATISKTSDLKIAQSSWNLDRLDGTGPSGYNANLGKMQMFYIDYTWYGAGFVRWGMRGARGNVTYAHKMPNNNINTEAYMRSGNLPGRYESYMLPPTTTLTSAVTSADTVISVADTSQFPTGSAGAPQTLAIRGVSPTVYSVTSISGSGTAVTYTVASTAGLSANQTIAISGATVAAFNGLYKIDSVGSGNFVVTSPSTGTTSTASGQLATVEYVNYTGVNGNTFTGLTRAQAGTSAITSFSITSGSNIATVTTTSGLQIGQRLVHPSIPDNTFITGISGTTLNLSQGATGTLSAATNVVAVPMGASSAQAFAYSATMPTAVELAWPTFAPAISHWGTSVIMDGRYDDDKSLLFTYGQTSSTALQGTGGAVNVVTPAVPTAMTAGSSTTTAPTITVAATTGLQPGMGVSVTAGTGAFPTNSYVTTVLSATQFTINANPTTALSGATVTVGNMGAIGSSIIPLAASIVSSPTGTSSLVPGMSVTGTNIPANATITSINTIGNAITISTPITTTAVAASTTIIASASTASKALFSIRVAPSVDNGIPANFGAREIVNRMQLILRALDITATPPSASIIPPINLLVTAVLNGIPTTTTAWTNTVKNAVGQANSSLAMIADYAGTNTVMSGGETTGGFFTSGTSSIDLNSVRDLGNSQLGGGGTTSNTNVYPDGPDTLTIVVQNLSSVPVAVSGRLSWTEAQA